ncbi:2-(1,2-epoxy-1,2-dihydrophenyl)acetyl-CoA isomerase [Amycolatopsis bartoniae]|uniref:Enoyl-CoA hydratase n=1 Tax=Amycolatopsis bartoniae TaxID=941986 RepID=A0A8H9M7T4_9PSEU|nr:enoyl-CoA hydratase/isomerase family protein [Amycolatopsis bartoniae]MBB2939901.1 2-(1,2-epoxy-1,2-dihydrophenyl)acetyl-CoA isomerase [Amycolatopsis bartoniae]TVT08313.1 enoyl-CoA hydratase/isomerase family protein [Amycolatopsis bartoniae]GHF35776.1 enoyl-CoA hydratase [Amycolatopsis bartoniae]
MPVEADHLLTERVDETLVVTLNRPARRNALTVALVTALGDVIETAPADQARAIVITGAPPVFCAGGDLTDLSAVADEGALAVSESIYGRFHRLVSAISESPVPVIAAVNGAALGAGLDLAAVCDFRIAASSAQFASSWINVGLVPGMGGAQWLTRLTGGARATELVLTGRTIDAVTAERWNLVHEVAEPHELMARAFELGKQLAALPPVALARSKAALRRTIADGLGPELATLGAVQGTLLTGPEFAERAARFRKGGASGTSAK